MNTLHKTRGGSRIALIGAAMLFSLFTSPAQENTGSISGTVMDATGASVPGAKIEMTSPSVPGGLTTTSDEAGNYTFARVPIATFAMTVTKQGFTTFRQQGLVVQLGSRITFNPKLTVGQVSEVIEVSEAAISIDPTSSRTATNIDSKTFDALPRSRNFQSLLAMAPGVRIEPKASNASFGGNNSNTSASSGIQVDGASGAENSFIIDGVDTTNVLNGTLRGGAAVPFEFLSEVQIKSGGFEAEFGGATGGVVNAATKSGSNTFHGQGLYQFQNSGMNPRPRGFWQGSPANADLPDFLAPKEDTYTYHFPGFTVGGPIWKNKIYFYSGYMPELYRTTREPEYASGKRSFQQNEIRHFSMNRVDYSPFSKLQLFSSWIWSPYKRTGGLPNVDPRRPAPSNNLAITGGFQPSQNFNTSGTYSITPNIVVQARFGYSYTNDKVGNYGLPSDPFITYQTASAAGGAGVPANVAGPNGFSNVSSTLQTLYDITNRKNLYLDGTYLKRIGGQQHTFKVGYAINQMANQIQRDYINGRFLIYWGDAYNRGSFTNVRGQYGYYTWEDGVKIFGDVSGRNQGLYFQDSWRIHKNVVLNIGLRTESEFLPPYRKEQAGVKIGNPISFGWGQKLAPRLGFAWDVKGDGTWKVFGNYGSFYDVMKYNVARGSFGGEVWYTNVYRLDNPNVFALSKSTPAAGGTLINRFDNRTLPINAQGVIDGIEPNIKPYQQREISGGLSRQLNTRLVAEFRYVHKQLVNTIEDIGVLDAEDNEVYLTGNPGQGLTRDTRSVYGQKTPDGKEFLVPQATRKYDAAEFSVRGQVWNKTFISTSYVLSRLWGNYSGLANSDENGRSNANNDRSFDLPYYYFDASGSQRNVFGRLATDRPHTFKFFASRPFNSKLGETMPGLSFNAWSGTPLSTTLIYLSAPTYPFGRGDLGRTPALTQTDISIQHTVKFGERMSARFEFNVFNALNQAAFTNVSNSLSRQTLTDARLPVAQFFRGYDPKVFYNPANTAGNPRINPVYNRPTAYQLPRDVRLGVRFMF